MKLTHFYHVYADADWQTPASEHMLQLSLSGLIDELDDLFLGIVGSKDNRARVKRELPGVPVVESDMGWEQVTLEALHEYAKTNQAKIFYAHTKGAWSRSELACRWRKSMTHDTVTRWRECVQALDLVQTVGPHYMTSKEEPHKDHKHFFGGNFWWARSEYVAKLPPLKKEHRFQAEGWIGLGPPSVTILRKGEPTWGNFWSGNE
jgi:hypothetical protein